MEPERETALGRMAASEESAVRELGDRIGYGRAMQLCEELWSKKLEAQGLPAGGAHAHYCCAAFLVPCPCCVPARQKDEDCACGSSCDWCCGACRVTKRVAQAIEQARTAP